MYGNTDSFQGLWIFNPGKDVAEIIEIWEGNSNENDIERSQNPVSILHGV